MEQTRLASPETQASTRDGINKRRFWELYSRREIAYYGLAVLVYFVLGITLKDKVLNIGIGPLFFIAWIWVIPPAWEKFVEWRSSR